MKFALELATPMLPNFLRFKNMEDCMVAVAELTDEQAAECWDYWKAAWIAHVKAKREARNN